MRVGEQGWERLSLTQGADRKFSWGLSDGTQASLPVRDEGWSFPMVLMGDLHGSAVTLLADQVLHQESL